MSHTFLIFFFIVLFKYINNNNIYIYAYIPLFIKRNFAREHIYQISYGTIIEKSKLEIHRARNWYLNRAVSKALGIIRLSHGSRVSRRMRVQESKLFLPGQGRSLSSRLNEKFFFRYPSTHKSVIISYFSSSSSLWMRLWPWRRRKM